MKLIMVLFILIVCSVFISGHEESIDENQQINVNNIIILDQSNETEINC